MALRLVAAAAVYPTAQEERVLTPRRASVSVQAALPCVEVIALLTVQEGSSLTHKAVSVSAQVALRCVMEAASLLPAQESNSSTPPPASASVQAGARRVEQTSAARRIKPA